MGKGRKPTPTALKILRGNPGRRRLPPHEPKPQVQELPVPEGLSAAAKKHWRELMGEAVRLGLVTRLDSAIFMLYIRTWDQVRKLEREVLERGVTVETGNGSVKRAPWDTALCQYQTLLRGLCSDLGFSPTSRSKATTVDAETEVGELFAFDGGKVDPDDVA